MDCFIVVLQRSKMGREQIILYSSHQICHTLKIQAQRIAQKAAGALECIDALFQRGLHVSGCSVVGLSETPRQAEEIKDVNVYEFQGYMH